MTVYEKCAAAPQVLQFDQYEFETLYDQMVDGIEAGSRLLVKKPKGGELTAEQITRNRRISHYGVIVAGTHD